MVPTIILLVVGVHVQLVTGARILLVPSDHGAHVHYFMVIGHELVTRGHQVHALATAKNRRYADQFNIPGFFLEADGERNDEEASYDDVEKIFFQGSKLDIIRLNLNIAESINKQCESFIGNNELMAQVESMNFNLMLMDGGPLSRCMYIIPHKLGVKYITLSAIHDPWTSKLPAMPSSEPSAITYFSEYPTFEDRLRNVAMCLIERVLSYWVLDNTLIEKYASEKNSTTLEELYLNSELWLVSVENLCLEYPRIYAPHYHFVGGINTYPAQPLPKHLEDFVNSAEKGVILVTFGSALKRVPADIFEKMLKAFAKLEQKILVRHSGNATDLPTNVKVSGWIPQNDVLGHSKTKLFITHAGNNGQLEALYHGVPMLSMPISLDQNRNARRSEHRGYGKTVNILSFDSDELLETINHILENSNYTDNIKRCSEIFRDFPHPRETVVFYVEHVLKYGGSHLKPAYLRMPLWEFFMLDVLMFVVVAIVVFVTLAYYCCSYLLRKCCSVNIKRKVE